MNVSKDCIFCKIIKGDVPSYKVYEDDHFLGFLNIHPCAVGHSLVIPKKHYTWVYDVPAFDAYWLVVLHITKAIQSVMKPLYVTYLTYGLEVPHAHIHIIPRSHKGKIIPDPIKQSGEEMEKLAIQILKITQMRP